MKKLKELSKAIDRLHDLYVINQDVMEADDAKDLLSTIESLQAMYLAEYKKQIEEFVDYMRMDFPEEDYDKHFTKWTETPYIITHGDKTVIVDNYADVYDALYTLLKDHLKDIGWE